MDEPVGQRRRGRRRSALRGKSSSGGRPRPRRDNNRAAARDRRLPPPFGRDPLRPFDARDVMHRAPPHEPPRHAFGRGINDVDRLGPVEQALGASSSLRGEGNRRRWWRGRPPPLHPPPRRAGDVQPPPTRSPVRANGFRTRLRPPHALRAQLHRQPVDQPRELALARGLLDQALLRRAQDPRSSRRSARRHRSRIPDRAPRPCRRAGAARCLGSRLAIAVATEATAMLPSTRKPVSDQPPRAEMALL